MNDEDYVTIKIPRDLYKKIEKEARNSDFKSVEEFIIFVLSSAVEEDEEVFNQEDEEKVKERLRALGYL